MTAEHQLGLFDTPHPVEVAKQLPEWFSEQQVSDALGYESLHDPAFKDIWHCQVKPHLEEREIYPGSRWPGPEYRGFFNEYRIAR